MKKDKVNKSSLMIWIMFIMYLLIFAFLSIASDGQSSIPWLALKLWSLTISIYLLISHKLPTKPKIIATVVLTAVYTLSIFVYSYGLFSIVNVLSVFLASSAIFSVFEKYSDNAICFIKKRKNKYNVLISIAVGIFFGLLFGAVNYFLMKGSNPIECASPLIAFLCALNPAIGEEICDRTIFYAFCLSSSKGEFKSKGQRFTYWFMMIIPHIIPHTAEAFIKNPIEWLVSVLLYALVFGFIFAVLQKKHDMLSAIIAHGTVDFIRFCIFGLPN